MDIEDTSNCNDLNFIVRGFFVLVKGELNGKQSSSCSKSSYKLWDLVLLLICLDCPQNSIWRILSKNICPNKLTKQIKRPIMNLIGNLYLKFLASGII